MAKEKLSKSELMDLFEKLAINALKPQVEVIMEGIKTEVDLETATRNILGKIGARITFGKDIYDGVMMKAQDKN